MRIASFPSIRKARILAKRNLGLTITLADITEEEFRVLELIEAERQERMKGEDGGLRGSR